MIEACKDFIHVDIVALLCKFKTWNHEINVAMLSLFKYCEKNLKKWCILFKYVCNGIIHILHLIQHSSRTDFIFPQHRNLYASCRNWAYSRISDFTT